MAEDQKQPEPQTNKNQEKKQPAGENIDDVKGVSALAYLIFFVPLLTNQDSQFAKFHANQGLLLLITGVIINTVGTILPFIGWFIILPLGWIFVVVLFIMGIVNAMNGEMKRLPLIGNFDILK